MENLHNLLVCRHSIRKYTDQQVKPEDVQLILEAALLSPTSKSSRSWQFIVVEDKDILVRMSECKPAGAMPLKGCAFAVVVCADPAKSDAWIEDASIAAEMMQLQAADLGIGSCWIQIRDRYASDSTPSQEIIQELLEIPETLPVVCVMTFGYPAEERRPVDTSKLLWEKVHVGTWKSAE
ncbi:MAG TPA: nitroreductase family protein [Muribaculaceae bacterium]|jgi:nitroreductase|nr:nitroreductase family protein [Muribaculaceae bacterium]